MQVFIFSETRSLLVILRAEHNLSGEASYTRHLKQRLNSSLSPYNGEGNSAEVCRLTTRSADEEVGATGLRQIIKTLRCKQYRGWTVLIKVPTLAQVWAAWMLSKFTRRSSRKVAYIVDGLLLDKLTTNHFFNLLYREPVLTIARLVLNNSFWCFPLCFLDLRYIFASNLQHEQGGRFISSKSTVSFIPNIADQLGHQKMALRSAPTKSHKQIKLGYIGHTYYVKGLSLLAQALAIISAEERPKPNIVFAFSGRGNLTELEAEQFSHHQQLGIVQRDDFLRQVNVLIFPFIYSWGTNVFPSAVLEAASVGVPSILPRLPLNVELMGKDYPLYFEPGCARDLAKVVSGLNTQMLEDAATVAAEVISTRHSKDNFFSSWSKVINASD